MHVGDDVGEGGSGEEFEAALRVADGGGGGRGEDSEEEMEGVHEEVAEEGALYFYILASRLKGASPNPTPAILAREVEGER